MRDPAGKTTGKITVRFETLQGISGLKLSRATSRVNIEL
jgi:hypothetical protein